MLGVLCSEAGAEDSYQTLDAHFGGFLRALRRGVQHSDHAVSRILPEATHGRVDRRTDFLLHHARYNEFVGSIQSH